MLRALLLLACLLAACAPIQAPSQTPTPHGSLIPYLTRTPSVTPATPKGLVVSFETPVPSPTPFTYEVKVGDTFGSIALRYGITVDQLVVANPDVSPNSMSVGTELMIPGRSFTPAASTSTPVPLPVRQIECYPTADQGMWCFVLVYNDTSTTVENLSAQVTLVDADGETLGSELAFSPLDILPVDESLPLMVYFPPVIPASAHPRVQLLTGIPLEPGDARYLPASLHNTLVQVDGSGRGATVSGTVRLSEGGAPAKLVWVAAVVYDQAGRAVGVRRWESGAGIEPGSNLPFSFAVASLGGEIGRVEFVVEARP
jgi:LysM repeat protein